MDGDFNPDQESYGNSDGDVQIYETINYGRTLDTKFNDDGVYIYNSGFQVSDDLLSLTGLSGNIDTTQTVSGDFIIGGDLTLDDSSTLTIDGNSKFFFVNGDFHTQEDSELILEDSIVFKNYQETDSMVINGDFSAGTVNTFKSIDSTLLVLMFNNTSLDVELSDCDFENVSLYGYTDTIIIDSSSTFINSRIRGANNLIVDDVMFDSSSIVMVAPGGAKVKATIKNSDFTLPHPDEDQIISLYRLYTYHITDNSFSNYASSYDDSKSTIAIEYSGTTGSTSINNINDNTYRSDENGDSNTNGILTFASIANIYDNDIQDQQFGVVLTGQTQSIISGNNNFCNEETQVIKNNDICQVYLSESSFPIEFIWNVIYDESSSTNCFVHHDINPKVHHDTVNVDYNYWGDNYDPYYRLVPLGHFDYSPMYDPCSKGTTAGTNAEILYQGGIEEIEENNYSGAISAFMELIEEYPESEQANNAMKDIFNIEPLTDNDYLSLKTYYLTEDAIIGNDRLKHLGENLGNKCDVKLGNYEDAIE